MSSLKDKDGKIETCPGMIQSISGTFICALTKSVCIRSGGSCIFLHWFDDIDD